MEQDPRRLAVDRLPAHGYHPGWIDNACERRKGSKRECLNIEISTLASFTEDSEPKIPEMRLAITVHIPAALREFTTGRAVVEVSSSEGTVSDALAALWSLHPGVRDRVINEQGQLRQHINIFVGNEHIRYTGGLATPVHDGSQISIVPAVSGGNLSLCGGGRIRPPRRVRATRRGGA